MTNLIEKALIIGFGILITTVFLSFSLPYIEQIIDYSSTTDDDLNDYLKLINDVDKGIFYIIENPNSSYRKEIYYPDNMNITIENKYANFQYIFQGKISEITLKYNNSLKSCYFGDLIPDFYLYEVYFDSNLIKLEIT
ncbi:MAG: hypothetical protein EU542_01475 [Promethearchaeota archaeon]|jgi:hypothetical protein|nr:MAG: hypothetical protein EU542_01475 [Candidatus Lokiarchaeota archaeon]